MDFPSPHAVHVDVRLESITLCAFSGFPSDPTANATGATFSHPPVGDMISFCPDTTYNHNTTVVIGQSENDAVRRVMVKKCVEGLVHYCTELYLLWLESSGIQHGCVTSKYRGITVVVEEERCRMNLRRQFREKLRFPAARFVPVRGRLH